MERWKYVATFSYKLLDDTQADARLEATVLEDNRGLAYCAAGKVCAMLVDHYPTLHLENLRVTAEE